MTGWVSFIPGALILTAIIVAAAVILWLVFGRKRRGEDKAIGTLEQMAHYKATSFVDGYQRRSR